MAVPVLAGAVRSQSSLLWLPQRALVSLPAAALDALSGRD